MMMKKPPSLLGLDQAMPEDTSGLSPFSQNLAIQQAGDQRDFGTPNFLGGVGGVNAHGLQTVLDAAGAQNPGGINMKGTIGTGASPIHGLQHAAPNPQVGAPDKEMELRVRRARMLNQEQPAANFTPNAGGYNPFPSS